MILKKAFWLFGISVSLLILFLPGYTKIQELRDKNHELQARIKELYKDNIVLQKKLGLLENDSLYQERVAREKMGVVRKGEVPVKIIPQEKQ
jgi:cell division protein FtsB